MVSCFMIFNEGETGIKEAHTPLKCIALGYRDYGS